MPRKKKKAVEEEISPEEVEVETKDKKEEKKDKKKKEKWQKILRKRIEVDFWKTDLHGKKIGIRQKDQQRAKSRQFSKDMNIFGSVKIDKEDSGHIGYRTGEWEDHDPKEGDLPRLVIRYFSETDRWRASIEQNNIKGLILSIGYSRGTPVFDIFIAGNTNIYSLEKIERGTGSMDKVVVPLILEKDGKDLDYFVFEEKRFTMGSDWKCYRANAKKKELAEFDSKKFNIGGKVIIDIYDPDLAENKIFINTLVLFGALIKFWDEVTDKMKDFAEDYIKGEIKFTPDRHELELMENPRGRRN